MTNLLDGRGTFLGILVAFLGTVGIMKYFTQPEMAQMIDLLLQIFGLAFAAYRRYTATKSYV
jgi:hypothetical protein